MYAIKTDISNWKNGELLLGQLADSVILEVEVDELPTYEYEEMLGKFTQRVFDGKFGEQVTYAELCEIRDLISNYEYEAAQAKSLSELKLMAQITDLEMALIEVI